MSLVDCIRSQKLYNVGMLQTTQEGEDVFFFSKVFLGIAPKPNLLSNNGDLECKNEVSM